MKKLALVLLSLTSAALADSPKPAIVLVHGACAESPARAARGIGVNGSDGMSSK